MAIEVNLAVRYAGIAAALLFAGAVIGFGAALQGFEQAQHPVALLGARGFNNALAFNFMAFVVPGILAGVVALALRLRLPAMAGWPLRIGAQLVFLAALAYIAMGLLPLDPQDLESKASGLHGTAWMLWSVALVPGLLLSGAALLQVPGWGRFAAVSLAAGFGVLVAGFLLTSVMPAGIAQRIAFGLWFAWLLLAAWPLGPRPEQAGQGAGGLP